MTESEARRRLLTVYGPCICPPDGCTGETSIGDVPPGCWCLPCGHLDVYADCFADTGEASGHAPLYRDNARYCPQVRDGLIHEEHDHRYATKGVSGAYRCTGMASEPWPRRPFKLVRPAP